MSFRGRAKRNSRTFIRESCYPATLKGSLYEDCLMNDAGRADRPDLAPRFGEDRPVGLIQIDAVAQERAAKHRFLHGAQLLERAVAAAVLDRRLRFHASDAEDVEREVEHELRRVHEDACAPEVGAEREAPFSDVEAGRERPHLEQT